MSTDVIADGARLAALRELGLLDTPPEPEFERFTELAADLLSVPVSLISLVDRDRRSSRARTVCAASGRRPARPRSATLSAVTSSSRASRW